MARSEELGHQALEVSLLEAADGKFDIAEKRDLTVSKVQEFENRSDVWRGIAGVEDLLAVVFEDCSFLIFDIRSGDRLKAVEKMPFRVDHEVEQVDYLAAAIKGGEFLIFLAVRRLSNDSYVPVLLSLDDRLEYQLRARVATPMDRTNRIFSAEISSALSANLLTVDLYEDSRLTVTSF